MDWWEKRLKSYEKPVGKVTYKEIPVMVTQSGQLACLPFTNDMPTIGITGAKRTGKSMFMHQLIDQIYWRTNDAMVFLNDAHFETYTYVRPQDDDKFLEKINALGMKPMILPVVHIFPQTSVLTKLPDNVAYIKFSLPLKVFFNSQWFAKESGKSGKYLAKFMEEIISAKSMEEAEMIIDENLSDSAFMKGAKEKLVNMLFELDQQKIISFDKKDTISEVTNDNLDFQHNAIIALMATRLLPSINTTSLKDNKFFPNYLDLLFREIFTNQHKGYFDENRIRTWCIFDELIGVDSTDKETAVSNTIQTLVTEGGPARIGFIWVSQLYKKVREGIRANTKFLFSFSQTVDSQIKQIAMDFDLTASEEASIRELEKERLECVGVAVDEKWVLYDLTTGKRTTRSGFIRGYAIPPLSRHKPPDMGLPSTKYSWKFAERFVFDKNIRLFNTITQKPILRSNEFSFAPTYDLGETSFMPGQVDLNVFIPKSEKILQIDYPELKSYGWEIINCVASDKGFKCQRITYKLKRIETPAPFRARIETSKPQDVTIEFNPRERMVRLRSPNISKGFTDWVRI